MTVSEFTPRLVQRPGGQSLVLVAIAVLVMTQFAVFHSSSSNNRWGLLSTKTTTATTTTRIDSIVAIDNTATQTTTTTKTTTKKNLLNITNKTLVIVMGNLRCGEPAWKTLQERVLDVNSADLALMLGYTMPRYQNASLFDRAKFVWSFPEREDWGLALDEMELNERKRIASAVAGASNTAPLPSWRETILPRLRSSVAFGGVKTPDGRCCSGGGAPQFVARYNIQERIRELDLTSYYDRFVIARSDSYYRFNLNLTRMDNEFVWAPSGCLEGCDFGGLNDRQIVVSSSDILTVLDGYPRMVRGDDGDARNYTNETINANPESFYFDSLRRGGVADRIRRYPQPFYSCTEPGDQASFESMPLTTMGEDGVIAKKKFEYNPLNKRFHQRCGRNPDCEVE